MDKRDEPILSRPVVVFLLATISCALWGSAFAMVKTGYDLFQISEDDPAGQLLFAGMRFTLAGIFVLLGTAVVRRRAPLPTRDDLAPIVMLGLSQTALQYAPFYLGIAQASGTNSSLVQGTSVFVQVILATLVFRQERLTGRKLVGCLLGMGGVLLVNLRGGGALGSWSLMGEGLILASVVSEGCAVCLMRRYSLKGDPLLLTGWQFIFGGLALVAVGHAMGGTIGAHAPAAMAVLAYLGMLSAVAFSIWSLLLKNNPVSHVAMYHALIPVFGVVFSVLLLGEVIPASQLPLLVTALALIAAGTVVVNGEAA